VQTDLTLKLAVCWSGDRTRWHSGPFQPKLFYHCVILNFKDGVESYFANVWGDLETNSESSLHFSAEF